MSKKSSETIDTPKVGAKSTPAPRKKKLGKGLGALLGETRREEPLVRNNGETGDAGAEVAGFASAPDSPFKSLPIARIEPLPGNPRKHFDESALEELAASIATRGVIQPIIVRPTGKKGRYQLVAGERRWRAAQKARLHDIPAIVRDLDEREVMALALIENLQREDLNPVEEARAYHRLAAEEGMTQADIARMVEKSRSHIANIQRLLALPDDVLDLVEQNKLTMGHARALIGHEDASKLAAIVVSEDLSVREIEKVVRRLAEPDIDEQIPVAKPSQAVENADIVAVEQHLEDILGLSVTIKADADPRSGSLSIRYKTLDQLDMICQRLTGGEI